MVLVQTTLERLNIQHYPQMPSSKTHLCLSERLDCYLSASHPLHRLPRIKSLGLSSTAHVSLHFLVSLLAYIFLQTCNTIFRELHAYPVCAEAFRPCSDLPHSKPGRHVSGFALSMMQSPDIDVKAPIYEVRS